MVAYDPNLDGTRVWGIFHIADGRDDRNCIPGERYCVSSFGGGQRRNTGKKQEPGQAGGKGGWGGGPAASPAAWLSVSECELWSQTAWIWILALLLVAACDHRYVT